MIPKRIRIAILLLFTLPYVGCQSGRKNDIPNGEDSQRSGKRIVAERVLVQGQDKIGYLRKMGSFNVEKPDEGLYFSGTGPSFDILPDRIVFMDIKQYKFYIFDFKGELLKTGGSHGQGPGEFQTPLSVSFLNDGAFSVFEQYPCRIIHFDKNGVYEKEEMVKLGKLERTVIPRGAFLGLNNVWYLKLLQMSGNSYSQIIFALNGSLDGGNVLYKTPSYSFEDKQFSTPYTASTFDVSASGDIALTFRYVDKIELTIVHPDETIIKFSKPFNPIPRDHEVVAEIEKRLAKSSGSRAHDKDMAFRYESSIRQLQFDKKGRLWILSPTETGQYAIYVLQPDDNCLIKVTAPIQARHAVFRVKDNNLVVLGATPDERSLLRAYLYEIQDASVPGK